MFFVIEGQQWLVSYHGLSKYANLESDSQPLDKLYFVDVDFDGKAEVFTIDDAGNWKVSEGGKERYTSLWSETRPIEEIRTGNVWK